MEYPPKQGHWSILRKGSMVFPREVKACFLGHFTAWLERDRDVFVQLNDEGVNSAGQTAFL